MVQSLHTAFRHHPPCKQHNPHPHPLFQGWWRRRGRGGNSDEPHGAKCPHTPFSYHPSCKQHSPLLWVRGWGGGGGRGAAAAAKNPMVQSLLTQPSNTTRYPLLVCSIASQGPIPLQVTIQYTHNPNPKHTEKCINIPGMSVKQTTNAHKTARRRETYSPPPSPPPADDLAKQLNVSWVICSRFHVPSSPPTTVAKC